MLLGHPAWAGWAACSPELRPVRGSPSCQRTEGEHKRLWALLGPSTTLTPGLGASLVITVFLVLPDRPSPDRHLTGPSQRPAGVGLGHGLHQEVCSPPATQATASVTVTDTAAAQSQTLRLSLFVQDLARGPSTARLWGA